MPIQKQSARQEIISAFVDINYTDLVSGVAQAAVDVPAGSMLQGGDVTVLTPWNSATSDVARVGDVTNNNRYASADINLAVAARTALTLTGFKTTGTEVAVTFKWTGVGAAPSAGKARLTVNYIREGRAAFSEGKGI